MNCLRQEIEKNPVQPEEIARLLRSIGASGRLVGFKYVVFIVYTIMQKPDERYWITKCAYPDAAKQYTHVLASNYSEASAATLRPFEFRLLSK